MNHIEILKDVLNDFKDNDVSSKYICNHILFCVHGHSKIRHKGKYYEYKPAAELALNIIQSHRPSETLFPEIYNHELFGGCGDSFWNNDNCNLDRFWDYPIRLEKVKYLELLIDKLQSGFDIGDVVKKKSNKPFKNGEHTDTIIGFTSNSNHPNNKIAAILKDSDTIVCLNSLKLDNTII